MNEINKLRIRLKNVQKNVSEYRMTVIEAKNLLNEIDNLIEQKSKVIVEKKIVEIPVTQPRTIDGGTF